MLSLADVNTRLASLILPLALLACGEESDDPAVLEPGGEERIAFEDWKADAPPSPTALTPSRLGTTDGRGAVLELVLTDVWGRLPDRPSVLTLSHPASGTKVRFEGYLRPLLVNLSRPGQYTLRAEMPDHAPESMSFVVGTDLRIPTPADQVTHWGFSAEPRRVAQADRTVHSLYLGLEHLDFAASGPAPRRGNRIELYDNGRDAFASLAADLYDVTSTLHAAFWLVKMDFQLVRFPSNAGATDADRERESLAARLKGLAGRTRLLLSQFNGAEDTLNEVLVLDDQTEAFGKNPRDSVEVLVQPNETEVPYRGRIDVNAGGWSYRERLLGVYPEWSQRTFVNEERFERGRYDRDVHWTDLQIASWHQKFAVLDERVAFLGGMNLNYTDWDTDALEVFQPLRTKPDADDALRAEIERGETTPDLAPRKDYMLRIEGPLVHDVAHLFQRRWDLGRLDGAQYAEHTTAFTTKPATDLLDTTGTGVQAQLNVTLPMPFWEHSILESFQRAIARADDYIYIEDQYFRSELLNRMLVDRMREDPDLKLIVVTKPTTYTDPGRKWTMLAARELADAFPDRFLYLTLESHDLRPSPDDAGQMQATFVSVDNHSKLFIVDDEILSVGSCNKNNRGVVYEGEANVLVRDLAFVSEVRRTQIARLLGPELAAEGDLDDPNVFFERLREVSERNAERREAWDGVDFELDLDRFDESLRPEGLVYPLPIPDRFWFDVGPDFA